MMAVDRFIKRNGKDRFYGGRKFEDEEEEKPEQKISLSSRGYLDLYKPGEEEKEKKESK